MVGFVDRLGVVWELINWLDGFSGGIRLKSVGLMSCEVGFIRINHLSRL